MLRHRSAVSGAPGSKIIKSLTYQRNFTNFLDPKYRESPDVAALARAVVRAFTHRRSVASP